jgi:hypothetical protein
MSSERVNIRSLRRQLQNCRVRSESGQYFIPDMSIISLITSSAVQYAVSELQCNADERIGLADRIYEEGKKVFAILILMGEEDSVIKFRNHRFLDDKLPLSEEDAQAVSASFGAAFADYQWELLPETFTPRMWENHQEFGLKKILPFIERPQYVGEGGFGEVVKIKILPSLQAFYPQMVGPLPSPPSDSE